MVATNIKGSGPCVRFVHIHARDRKTQSEVWFRSYIAEVWMRFRLVARGLTVTIALPPLHPILNLP